jgi:hypothetical protein
MELHLLVITTLKQAAGLGVEVFVAITDHVSTGLT